MKLRLLIAIITTFLFLTGVSKVNAWTCNGSSTCCVQESQVCDNLCDANGCRRVNCRQECTQQQSGFACAWGPAGGCGQYNCGWVISSGCFVSGNPPPGPPPSGGGGCNSGWCTTGPECAAVGGSTGSGAGYCNPPTLVQCCVNPPPPPPACSPSCSPACGQPNGCGGVCGNTSAGNAGAIATTTPADGGSVTTTVGGLATISWSASALADRYDLQLYPQDNPDCSDPRAYCTFVSTGGGIVGTSYSFTPQASQYVFLVRGVNNSCAPLGQVGAWRTTNFTIVGPINGTVYSDPNGVAALSGASCVPNGGPNTPIRPGVGSVVTSTDAGGSHPSATVLANGTYSTVGLFNSAATVTLTPGDSTYACTCPVGCSYGGVVSPETGVNFYVSQIGGSWFQSRGGDIGVGGTGALTFTDPINAFCTSPTCSPYPLIPPTGGGNGQVGTLMSYRTSSIDVSSVTGNQNSPVGPVGANFPVKTRSALSCKENYDYFYRLYSMGNTPQEDFIGPANPPDNALKPSVPPTNERAYFRNGDLTIASDWTLGSGESIVIFVDGDLNVTNNSSITVPTNGFLAFMVSGDIIFDPTIGTAASATTGNIQGVYIANGGITIQTVGANPATAEKKFVGEGTFAACGNIELERDFRNSPNVADGLNNNRYPSELFVFRPDFVANTPDRMKRPIINWREVAP